MIKIIENNFFDIFTTMAKDFIVFHSLSYFLVISKAIDPILTTQSPLNTSYHIQFMSFGDLVAHDS